MTELWKRTLRDWLVSSAIIVLITGLLVLGALGEQKWGDKPKCEDPAADGVVTRAEIEAMLVVVNREHSRMTAAIEAAEVRIDKVIDAVDAMAPQMDGRAKAPKLLQEARR